MRRVSNFLRALILVLPSVIFAQEYTSISSEVPLVLSPEYLSQSSYNSRNYTRSKRQLFRDDIPHHRPLSGNVYYLHAGWPHPGRWSDGQHNPHKPSARLPPPHQHYIDMLDSRKNGYRSNSNGNSHHGGGSGGGSGVHFSSGPFGSGFQTNIIHPGHGVSDYKNTGVHQGLPEPHLDIEYEGPKAPNFDFPDTPPKGPPKIPNFQSFPHPHKEEVVYGKPNGLDDEPLPIPQHQHHGPDRPKTFIHYHPIQYGSILNIPESEPEPHHYGSPEQPNPGPVPVQGPEYGPPNHVSGSPLGPRHHPRPKYAAPHNSAIQGGFIPSKGIPADEPRKPHPPPRPYHFNPFKIFSRPPPKFVEHDAPVAIPILAQFHTSKPAKYANFKNMFNRPAPNFAHHPVRHGPRRPKGPGPPFPRLAPPHFRYGRPGISWLSDHGL